MILSLGSLKPKEKHEKKPDFNIPPWSTTSQPQIDSECTVIPTIEFGIGI